MKLNNSRKRDKHSGKMLYLQSMYNKDINSCISNIYVEKNANKVRIRVAKLTQYPKLKMRPIVINVYFAL